MAALLWLVMRAKAGKMKEVQGVVLALLWVRKKRGQVQRGSMAMEPWVRVWPWAVLRERERETRWLWKG